MKPGDLVTFEPFASLGHQFDGSPHDPAIGRNYLIDVPGKDAVGVVVVGYRQIDGIQHDDEYVVATCGSVFWFLRDELLAVE